MGGSVGGEEIEIRIVWGSYKSLVLCGEALGISGGEGKKAGSGPWKQC